MDHLKYNRVLQKTTEWLFLIFYYGESELTHLTLSLGHDMIVTTDFIILNHNVTKICDWN